MKKRANTYRHTRAILPVFGALFLVAGCLGVFANRTGERTARSITFEADNCTRCHQAWADAFEYYRGWDRYGYYYENSQEVGFYDPWCEPDVANRYHTYYATDWWESPELYPWPDNVADIAESMSILASPGGLPHIPRSRNDITGHVITVAKEGGDTSSIQNAVDRASPGTTVFVRPGEYNETVILKNGVSLIGENLRTTIINPLNSGHAVVAANNSIIAGFTITGTGIVYATGDFNCGVYVSGCDSTCIIANNIFRENGLFGVWIDGTPDAEKNRALLEKTGKRQIETYDRPYVDYPNPIIVGNTFYRIGQRGVFCVHARGEIFNNVFSGNVKAVGMERHSRPFFHHNVCYFNNVPMAVNRSEPIVCNNIMLRNQWGQRMLRGANPVIFNNVTWNSPFFRDFDEKGLPIPYKTHPGTNERTLDPGFADPLGGDFSFKSSSPLAGMTSGFAAVGIIRDSNLPQPPFVECQDSYGREVLSMNDDIMELIDRIEAEDTKIGAIRASYGITFESYLDVTGDERGDPVSYELSASDSPVVTVEYTVPRWSLGDNGTREKEYRERIIYQGVTKEYSGTVRYDGSSLAINSTDPALSYPEMPDSLFIGERPIREKPGGFYRDYDQFVMGAIGPTGTFLKGYLRIMGGVIRDEPATVDGHECIVVRYPHIGTDQYFLYYLDPAIGYRPRKLEHYYHDRIYRVIDSYRYRTFFDGIHLPVHVSVTDYVVTGDDMGKKAAFWELSVDQDNLEVNRKM